MANADNVNRNPKLREAHVARKCSYKELMSCQPFNFKGSEGAIRLIYWFERAESVFSRSNCTDDCKKYYPWTKIQKMEDEFYHLTVKGNDLKIYVRKFQKLATLCPTMVSNSEKLLEAFIGGLPRSIEGNVTAFKPQTLEEAISISQRLMDQVTKHIPIQVSSDHKRKFDDRRTFNNNNYRNTNINNHHNNYKSQQDRRSDKSFISLSFAYMLKIPPITIDAFYDIEMADENLVSTNTVIQGCTLTLLNQPFEIDLMPIKLGSFDFVIGMDWLSKNHAKILCDEKVIHIPINGETLIIRGLHVDPAKIEALKNWETPTTPIEIRQFLGLAGYYQRFIEAYKLELPKELSNVYNTFHSSNLKKCLSDESLVIPIKELQFNDKLNFVEDVVEIMDQEIRQLRQSRIPIVKVRWDSKRGPKFTWERKDEIHAK
uniref:Reverse transcriptase domain-containing protein n=1 Tax=Tanacetum cinerariifolium TaxID=118510 RepID=A0A699I9G1_TANCI|nr:reverse transcriptase domain-containing protein [Tanacetum cinerariifolium]